MKSTFLSLIVLLSVSFLWGQGKAPATYPIGKAPETEMGRAFSAAFDESNVGNLHVFGTLEAEPSADYFYVGTAIDHKFYGLLSPTWQRALLPKTAELYAIKAIRHGDGVQYIMRFYTPDQGNQIELFTLINGELRHLTTLAYIECSKTRCIQLDSWILDVDGDTDLDLVKKLQIWDRQKDRVADAYINLFAQLKRGSYQQTDETSLTKFDFISQPIDTSVLD